MEYHQFTDVFDKQHSRLLPEHCPYNLTIQTTGGLLLSLGPIYSLSILEMQTLWEFTDENIKSGTIQPFQSPERAPVVFVKKKNRNLRLYVDYWDLNKITQKDWYPILLISDLLDAPKKARVYMKIDLRNAYHLVYIAKGNKWKMAFRTQYRSFE